MHRETLRELGKTFEAGLAQYDRENSLAADRHPVYCDCGACELVKASRDLVRLVEALNGCDMPTSTRCPSCGKISRWSTAGCDHCDHEDK